MAAAPSIDWVQIARSAAAAGDVEGARAAQLMAAGYASGETPQQSRWVSTVVKAAIKAALKHGTHALPKAIRPYASKLYNLIDQIDSFKELALATMFIKAGLPPDLARTAAQWIATWT